MCGAMGGGRSCGEGVSGHDINVSRGKDDFMGGGDLLHGALLHGAELWIV